MVQSETLAQSCTPHNHFTACAGVLISDMMCIHASIFETVERQCAHASPVLKSADRGGQQWSCLVVKSLLCQKSAKPCSKTTKRRGKISQNVLTQGKAVQHLSNFFSCCLLIQSTSCFIMQEHGCVSNDCFLGEMEPPERKRVFVQQHHLIHKQQERLRHETAAKCSICTSVLNI